MGCCSGRCTLAFICGMQLVSAKITIDPAKMMIDPEKRSFEKSCESSANKQVVVGTHWNIFTGMTWSWAWAGERVDGLQKGHNFRS